MHLSEASSAFGGGGLPIPATNGTMASSGEEFDRRIVSEFCHLLEKSKQLFNGLRDLPQYGHKQWQVGKNDPPQNTKLGLKKPFSSFGDNVWNEYTVDYLSSEYQKCLIRFVFFKSGDQCYQLRTFCRDLLDPIVS
jgi:hypothetical protein